MFLLVSYPYHAYLESCLFRVQTKIKNSCWMKHGKTFCNTFVTDVYREKIPGFGSKKTKQKAFDFHISNMFLYLILVA